MDTFFQYKVYLILSISSCTEVEFSNNLRCFGKCYSDCTFHLFYHVY